MKDFLRVVTNRIGSPVVFCLIVASAMSQATFRNDGVRSGVVKVKFTSAMTSTLNTMNAEARNGKLSTGMQPFDAVAQQSKASKIYRLFPFDDRNEHKLRRHGLHLWYVVEIDENINPKNAAAQFRELAEVERAEVEFEKGLKPYSVQNYEQGPSTFSTLPFNDPLLKDQWHYHNTGQAGLGQADVNLFEAWKKTTGAGNIIIAVHDEGVDVKHNDLKANIWVNEAEFNGLNNVDDDGNGYVDDIHGYNFSKNKGAVDAQYHGTHVAGTVAAVNNNGLGVAGVAGGNGSGNGAKIMSLQIIGGGFIENSFIYAANNGAVISQNSWGYTVAGAFEQSVLDAIGYFVEEAGDYPGSPMRGGIVIFAAGNYFMDAQWYPGFYDRTLAVAAIGPEWKITPYSNHGAWVDISAPGGDIGYGIKGGVLSTIPGNQYAYLEGTSMAAPHVSGIAALALANRTKQLTNTELWNKLVTGVVDLDQHNPDFTGKLGSGAIDALLAIQNNEGKAPAAVTDLTITGLAQEFATLSWTIPADEDDGQPVSIQLYYHTQPITAGNLSSATKVHLKNSAPAGDSFSYEVTNLLGLTSYYFVVTSTDRWGNASVLSNVVSGTTNEGPSIAVDENSQAISIAIDAATSTTAAHNLTIINNASGILRWNHFMRHKNTALSFNATNLHYPVIKKQKSGSSQPGMQPVTKPTNTVSVSSMEPVPMSFTPVEKSYANWPTNIIGETDLELTNSAAAKFFVTETEGFNLTHVSMYLKHNPVLGPVIVEVYKGSAPVKNNLVYAQEYSNWSPAEAMAYITLDEQLYFESGSTFWVVLHVPAGNQFPLGIGYEADPVYSTYCFLSNDLGSTWVPLEVALNDKNFAWAITAASYNQHLGTYLSLEPGSGDIAGNESMETVLTAQAATLINGNYSANLVIASNDPQQRELKIPVSVTVSGNKPWLKYVDIADFGSVFKGTSKTLDLVIENRGYGNFNDPVFSIDNPAFTIDGYAPWQIKARETVVVNVKFSPAVAGNSNGTLTITNGEQTYQIFLAGVGAETSTIAISPASQVVNHVTIGDEILTQVTVQNTGSYPLKYFIPGFDNTGISEDWPFAYHAYGYSLRTNHGDDPNPIDNEFQDIAATGVKITSQLRSDTYYALDMGFEFPFYGDKMKTIYIAQKGFTVFDNSVRPINTPTIPGNQWTPKGYISILGAHLNYTIGGDIFYQVEEDRLIIQYNNVGDGWNPETITAQMVLYADGNIRFFYDQVGWSSSNLQFLSILIEDMNQSDGIVVHNWQNPREIYSGLAIGFDYPGPNMITAIENGSGIVPPGGSQVVGLTMNTSSLTEGLVNRYINFISNDPFNPQKNALIQLDVNAGGTPQPEVSVEAIDFGDVFQGAMRTTQFTIKNSGTANVVITGMNLAIDAFVLQGETTTIIKPGLYKKYEVEIPTDNLGLLSDQLTISYADGSEYIITISGNVVVPPAIQVDLSLVQEALLSGETANLPFEIQNTGLANLEVAAVGNQWLSFNTTEPATGVGYTFEKHNDGNFYQWIDIRKTGTQMSFIDFDDYGGTFWRELELPFPVTFYGETYTSMKIGDNGIISFEDDPQASFFTDYIPSAIHPGPCIMPYWTFSGFSDYLFPKEDIGIFYQFYDDKFIITWSYFTNNFGGMGDPISAQVIFYKNGTMKFQYKKEEGGVDLTSHFGTIGLQKNSTTGLAISQYEELDHGSGLAFVIIPVNQYTVSPSSSLHGSIVLDASNLYGGQYNTSLKIQNNTPNNELLLKPVELTVTGEAILEMPEVIDFENKMIVIDGWSYTSYYKDVNITNTGSAPATMTWAQMTDGMQGLGLQVWALVDGWFGPEWRWADIAELYSPWVWQTPVFTIKPGDVLKARAVFTPSFAGDFADELVLTTSLGEIRIAMSGTGNEPPVMVIDNTPIIRAMNLLTETATASIAIDNLNGASELQYEVSIDFARAGATATQPEAMADRPAEKVALSVSAKKITTGGARKATEYNRTLKHTGKDTPDTFVGTGGAAPFTIAAKFNAGSEGFNVSHIETWFRAESLNQGVIHVEVRAGGNSLANSVVLTSGSKNFTNTGFDETGNWLQIMLNQPAGIYPNEDFYVVVTLPFGVQYPQGTVTDEPVTPGRYYYQDQGLWHDVQEEPGFQSAGWLMFAAEETPSGTSWLTVTSPPAEVLQAGETGTINLLMEGAYAKRGLQAAEVVIKSNDPANSIVRVPVSLHVNEGPYFSNVPSEILISEGQTRTYTIGVTDKEGHAFTVMAAQAYPGVTHSVNSGSLTLVLAPDYGHAGTYVYSFTATDQYDAVTQINIPAEVRHTNRAPIFIGDGTINFTATGKLNEYSIASFFADPDGDSFTFTVVNSNQAAVEVFASVDRLLIKPLSVGESNLIFTVTDVHGARRTETVGIIVDIVLSAEQPLLNNGLQVFPNPVIMDVVIIASPDWSGNVVLTVVDNAGRILLTKDWNTTASYEQRLNLTHLTRGLYMLKAASVTKQATIKIFKK